MLVNIWYEMRRANFFLALTSPSSPSAHMIGADFARLARLAMDIGACAADLIIQ